MARSATIPIVTNFPVNKTRKHCNRLNASFLEKSNKSLVRRQENTTTKGPAWGIIEWSLPRHLPSQSRRMELMYHYSTSTSLTLSLLEHTDIQQIWKQQIQHEAQAHAFLLVVFLGSLPLTCLICTDRMIWIIRRLRVIITQELQELSKSPFPTSASRIAPPSSRSLSSSRCSSSTCLPLPPWANRASTLRVLWVPYPPCVVPGV